MSYFNTQKIFFFKRKGSYAFEGDVAIGKSYENSSKPFEKKNFFTDIF